MRAEGERVRDPVCAFHGLRWSAHENGRCLYCCICFNTLTPDECATDSSGQKWDICKPCSLLEWHPQPPLARDPEWPGLPQEC